MGRRRKEGKGTHVELLGDGVLLVPRRGNGNPRLRPLPQPRERVVRRQPRVPVERQVLHLHTHTHTQTHNHNQTRRRIGGNQPWFPEKSDRIAILDGGALSNGGGRRRRRLRLREAWMEERLFFCTTLVWGSTGTTRVHRGRTLPSATHVSQCSPASQFRSSAHVCPTFLADTTAAGEHSAATTTATAASRRSWSASATISFLLSAAAAAWPPSTPAPAARLLAWARQSGARPGAAAGSNSKRLVRGRLRLALARARVF